MVTVTPIDGYEVMYSSNTFLPRVWLRKENKYIGQLIFHPNTEKLPKDSEKDGQFNLNYHLDDCENTIDLLRNEKPMYLLWCGPGGENGIKTTPEPIGENEH